MSKSHPEQLQRLICLLFAWELTRDGIELLEKMRRAFVLQKYDVRECHLWTKNFKKALDPTYEPSSADKSRSRDYLKI
jgi:hypothetical protein